LFLATPLPEPAGERPGSLPALDAPPRIRTLSGLGQWKSCPSWRFFQKKSFAQAPASRDNCSVFWSPGRGSVLGRRSGSRNKMEVSCG
jgi:hypothetical protein